MENKVFGQSGKVGETDKLNIDSIIARLLEGKYTPHHEAAVTGQTHLQFSRLTHYCECPILATNIISEPGWT